MRKWQLALFSALLALGCGRHLPWRGVPEDVSSPNSSLAQEVPLQPDQQTIAGLKVSIWRPSSRAPWPLVIFSHGFHGSSTQSKFLMKALADHGYLVMAPNHRDAGFGGMRNQEPFGDPNSWTEDRYKDRGDDIRNLLDTLKSEQSWAAQIDWSKIGLAGHSLGGYTVLGLAGGWPSWRLPGIKAVLALSPYSLPFQVQNRLHDLQVPIMYQGGTLDVGITPFILQKGGAFSQTSPPVYFVELRGAGHFAWTDLNQEFQPSVVHYSIAFLDRYVKGDASADLSQSLPDVALLWSKLANSDIHQAP